MMRENNHIRPILLVAVIAIAVVATVVERPQSSFSRASSFDSTAGTWSIPEPALNDGAFHVVRNDMRRCASPLCGGFWVSRVNFAQTRCANGRWSRECYVAEIDWNGRTEVEPGKALLRGSIVARSYPRFGNLGAFRVSESWQSPTETPAKGTFYRVRDRGVRCITHPCLTHSANKLNASATKNIAGADLTVAGASGEQISDAAAAMTEPGGVIVAGYFAPVTGPGGRAQTLKATKFYLRADVQIGGTPPPGSKRCFKTGCSSHVCSDENVMTTCEFRPEYACYQKAICERQKSGECGFTMTSELRSCLERARRSPQ